jgi:hypothetical protein
MAGTARGERMACILVALVVIVSTALFSSEAVYSAEIAWTPNVVIKTIR